MDKPNILFFFPDQHRYDWTSLNNDLPLETPNYERLCREGTFFDNAICPSPLCSPSRACMAGGVRYARTGVIENAQDFPHTFPTNVYKKLRDSGYHVMGCGKFDLRKPSHDHGAEGQHIVDGVNYLKELGFSDGIDNAGKWDGFATFHRGDQGRVNDTGYLLSPSAERKSSAASGSRFPKHRVHNRCGSRDAGAVFYKFTPIHRDSLQGTSENWEEGRLAPLK